MPNSSDAISARIAKKGSAEVTLRRHVPDDSNLTCHVIDTSLEVLIDERSKRGLGPGD